MTVSNASGDFTPSSLAHVMNTDTVNALVVQSWIDRAGMSQYFVYYNLAQGTSASRKSTLVFCADLAHVHDLTNEFRKRGIDARYLHAKTPPKERQRLLDEFRSGVYPVLVNCGQQLREADRINL